MSLRYLVSTGTRKEIDIIDLQLFHAQGALRYKKKKKPFI